MEDNRHYPVGKFRKPEEIDMEVVRQNISRLKEFPEKLEKTVSGLSSGQLATRTLPGHWTVAQVVNHIADSHMNMIVRVKMALTENNPVILPYNETLWANLCDGKNTDISDSLAIIRGVHNKISFLMSDLSLDDLKKTYFHPEDNETYSIGIVSSLYAWHGEHHLGHIQELAKEKNWQEF